MGDEAVLSVKGLSKKFCPSLRRSLRYGVGDIFAELNPFARRAGELRPGEFWALDDISFELKRGESLAVVGRNGAGKSTLLKILYGLIKPDRGEVRIDGRVEAIIELGTGFNNLLTARENIATAAALHSLDRQATRRLTEAALDFAGLGEFSDAPMQTYSSGMKARLGFALTAHLEPDLLLVDEALAVGDIDFQRKAVAHIRGFLEKGGSLIFVSHHYYQIQTVCNRGLLIDRGRQLYEGTALGALHEMYRAGAGSAPPAPAETAGRGPVRIEGISIRPAAGSELRPGEPVRIALRYRASEPVPVFWGFSIWTEDQWVCLAGEQSAAATLLAPGRGELTCTLPNFPFSAGTYLLQGALVDPSTLVPFDLQGTTTPTAFEVVGAAADIRRKARGQILQLDVDWAAAP